MLRKLAAVGVIAGSSVLTSVSHAVGLGEIKLHSALNQPLNAEIRLYQVSKSQLSSLKIGLAGATAFERANIDRPFFLTQLDFEVVESQGNSAVIRVTSDDAVREPYLNFLVAMEWGEGKLFKEYTLLMDLPSMRPTQPTSAPTRTVTETRSERPQAQTSRTTTSSYKPVASGQYRIQSNDTLWDIALKHRPDSSYSPHQVMKAIQDMNPNAFIGGNMNRIKAGAVLNLPSAGDIAAVNRASAVNELRRHNEAVVSGEVLDATDSSYSAQETPSEDRLVLSSGSTQSADSGLGDSFDGASSGGVGELSDVQDELARERLENEELAQRIAELESQLTTANQLLSLRSDELASTQAVASSTNDSAVTEAEDTVSDESSVIADDESQAVVGEQVEEQVEESSAEQAIETAPASKVATVVTTKKKPTALDWVQDNLLLVGSGVVAFLLALLMFFGRRGSRDEETYEQPLADIEYDQSELADSDEDDLEAMSEQSRLEGALADIDLRIAYGEYDEAEDELNEFEEEYGENNAIRLKRCELYVEMDNRQRFDEQLAEIRSSGDEDALSHAEAMIPKFDQEDDLPDLDALGLGLGNDVEESAAEALEATNDPFEADDLSEIEALDDELESANDADDEAVTSMVNTGESGKTEQDDHDLDFDLDLPEDELGFAEVHLDTSEETGEAMELDNSEIATLETDMEVTDEQAADLDPLDMESLAFVETTDAEVPAETDAGELADIDLDLDLGDVEPIEQDEQAATESVEAAVEDFEGFDDVRMDLETLDAEIAELDESSEALSEISGEESLPSQEEELSLDDSDIDLDGLDDIDLQGLEGDEVDVDETEFNEPLDSLDDIDLDNDFDILDIENSTDEPAVEAESADVDAVELEVEDTEALDVSLEDDDDLDIDSVEMTADTVAADLEGLDDLEGLSFLEETDEVATKLDLARAYIDMGDSDGAREILDEVMGEGNEEQKSEALELSNKL